MMDSRVKDFPFQVTFSVVLVLLMFVTGRSNREIKLIDGVEYRIRVREKEKI